MRHGIAFVLLLTTALPAHASFDPVAFFRGRSHGDGQLKIIFQSPKAIAVDSEGREEPDGTLLLEQRVQEAGTAPRTRYWRLKLVRPGHFTGTLTDAAGPVTIDLVGNRALIRYTMKNNMGVEQWLTPTGPRSVDNQMRVRRFGFVVARFHETIRKLD